jgi:pSer/pThr/pTyr-binding forkhead associated (FHA) protein
MNASESGLVLRVIAGNASGTEIHIDDVLLIGRHADGVGQLGDDDELSRRHALISRSPDGEYTIQDLGSTNGTIVNGGQIGDAVALAVGDTVELGNTTLVVDSTGAAQMPSDLTTQQPLSDAVQPQSRIELRIEIDVDRRVASILLDEGSDRVELVHEGGRWRIGTPS